MTFDPSQPTIPLDTDGDCPHCGRPILGLTEDRCGFCRGSLAPGFSELPSVHAQLAQIAPGWTPKKITQWALQRPSELSWAMASGHWRNLAWFVHSSLWMGWANGLASLKGRGRTMNSEDLRVGSIQLAGLGHGPHWIALRVQGERLEHPWQNREGWMTEFPAEPRAFTERWILTPTGNPDIPPACTVCGAPLAVVDSNCHYCQAPATFAPGPWLVVALHAEPGPSKGGAPSPFEASGSWGPGAEQA